MVRSFRQLLRFLVALCVVSACSVKELRDECPVYVTVLTDRFVQSGLDNGTVSFSAGTLLKRDDISFLDYIGRGYTYPCPRDYARAAVMFGVNNGKLMEDVYNVPQGRCMDRIWSYGESFSVNADEYVIDAVPHKQHCLIKFVFDDSPVAPPDYKWRFRICADHSGFNIYTGEPVEGEYSCPVGPNSVGEWYGVLPRQVENNMRLEIILPYEEGSLDGRVEYVIDLGQRFATAGYDWDDEDLKDMVVNVGFADLSVTINVVPWDGVHYGDYEI